MKPEEFGPFLAEQRKARDLTQYELAEKLNITVSAVSKYHMCIFVKKQHLQDF